MYILYFCTEIVSEAGSDTIISSILRQWYRLNRVHLGSKHMWEASGELQRLMCAYFYSVYKTYGTSSNREFVENYLLGYDSIACN